jgi:hypothetical protein
VTRKLPNISTFKTSRSDCAVVPLQLILYDAKSPLVEVTIFSVGILRRFGTKN